MHPHSGAYKYYMPAAEAAAHTTYVHPPAHNNRSVRVGNVIPTGSVFCLLGILRMSYVHTVKEYKIVQENTYALLKPILSVLGPSLRNDTSNDTWCICWCYCTILPSRPSTSALVTPRRRGYVRNNSRMLPSSAGRSMRNAPKSTN